jgi:type VI secretion system protein ImpF
MARSDADLNVSLSLLDRLIDREPQAKTDPSVSRAQSVRLLKAALRRDLEWLLNTRRNPLAAPESMNELSKSLYNYGLPDFSALSIGSPKDRDRLLVELESTVAMFDPRLTDIRVSMLDEAGGGYARTIHFQIEAMLQMDPAPEQVAFDTILQLSSGEYQIRGERGA